MADKTLILYFPVDQHTESLAKTIQEKVGADIEEVHSVGTYPDNYNILVTMAKEQIEKHKIPEAKALERKSEDYGAILVGAPNWWSYIVLPLLSLIKANKVEDKKVGIFATHIGGRVSGIEETVKKEWPNNDYLESLEIYGSGGSNRERLIDEWLERVSLK